MPVVCPGCGTLVAGEARVCPACHHALHEKIEDAEDGGRWCGSCGSPIPQGLDACPECGMPVDGAFDDDATMHFGRRVRGDAVRVERSEEGVRLISAVPPVPQSGEYVLVSGKRPERTRLFFASALSALLLVGGTTLYLTKPWGKSPEPIQVREDADTTMEGFPGVRRHLTSQDLFAEERHKEQAAEQEAKLVEARGQMKELCGKLDDSYAKINEYLSSGYRRQGDGSTSEAIALNNTAHSLYESVEAMDLNEQNLIELRERSLVLAGYLKGASSVLSQAWIKADQAKGSQEAVFLVRSVLEGENDYSYEEWISLFKNAYGIDE